MSGAQSMLTTQNLGYYLVGCALGVVTIVIFKRCRMISGYSRLGQPQGSARQRRDSQVEDVDSMFEGENLEFDEDEVEQLRMLDAYRDKIVNKPVASPSHVELSEV